MLSKEEREKAKECLQETIQNTYAEGKAIKLNNVLKYIDQLESDKQKLIETLEEKIKELEEKLKKQHGRVNEVTCFTEGELYQLEEILSMIKEGEVK